MCIIGDGFLKTVPGGAGLLGILAMMEQHEPGTCRLSQTEIPFFGKLRAEGSEEIQDKTKLCVHCAFALPES